MMLHKGFDTFMSDEHYRKLYWRHLREEAEVIAENCMIPNLFCEGRYMTRLDCLTELPKGKAYCHFEDMDMGATKKKLNVEAMFETVREYGRYR